jgi:hypothetical protein
MQRVKLTKIFEEVGQINLKLSFEKNCEKRHFLTLAFAQKISHSSLSFSVEK